ncbi:AraC family transcriptional regulator [Pseudomonas fluorescens]|uniref:AraC family transcriptional regulator n=2 Tax=Pseudomonas fluorescens TaxID=294 RepID=A0A379IHN7_PSEFL|nr:AraC family transcriptional regulator [Pseudomonas fluorescens]
MSSLKPQTGTLNHPITHIEFCDSQRAQSWMTTLFGPHSLNVHSPDRIHFRHTLRLLQAATVGYIEYGTDLTVSVDAQDTLQSYSVELPIQGHQRWESAHQSIVSDQHNGLILSSNIHQELHLSGDCKKIQIVIPRSLMRANLESLLHRPIQEDLQFVPSMSSTLGTSAGWWRMARHFIDEACHADSYLEHQGLASEIESVLVKGLILAQPNNYSCALNKVLQANLPGFLQRAINFIHRHAKEEIKLNAIVASSGVSRLTLFKGFKKHIGVPPMFYIRRYRLGEIRKTIMRDRSNSQISRIAMDWGYTHLGRFASDYRKFFGECPSHTAKHRQSKEPDAIVTHRQT